jgi:peptidoglycan/LPS O-acetylase OafA/YrhL
VRAAVGDIAALDGLRGVAVLWVILFHAYVLRGGLDDPWMKLVASSKYLEPVLGAGYLGVDLFFLLSGFLLSLPWLVNAMQGKPPPAWREFYARRFRRIAPAYYVQLALLFVLVLPLLKGGDYWRSDLYVYLYNLAAHAALLHNTTPLTSGSMEVNGALWTLAVEVQFYVLMPVVAVLFVRRPYAMLAAAFAIAILWHHAAGEGLDPLVSAAMTLGSRWSWPEASVRSMLLHQLPGYLAHFALGIVLARAWLRWRERAHSPLARSHLDSLLAIALGLLYWVIAIDGRLVGDLTWALPALCLGMLLFWAALGDRALARHLLARGPLAFLGRVSYSAYLCHLPLLLLWNRYAGALHPWASLPLYLAALVAIAWLSWRFVELPFLRKPEPRAPFALEPAESRT